jgi:hypothetical protein
MTFHSNAQGATLASGELVQPFLSQGQLWQHSIGNSEQILSGLRQPEAASLS